jgi:hypothetical protein
MAVSPLFQPKRYARAQIKINQQIFGLIVQQADYKARMGTHERANNPMGESGHAWATMNKGENQ